MSTAAQRVHAFIQHGQQLYAPRGLLAHRSFRRSLILASGVLLLLFGFVTLISPSTGHGSAFGLSQQDDGTARKGRFHFLVPGTSSNPDLCKLMLSAQTLDYPTPVLINFDHPENPGDDYDQHLAKPQGLLDYLDSIGEQDAEGGVDEDLVLIVDGYDVWMQLRRDVMLSRYYEINNAADARTNATYGEERFREHDMRQTIIFGPDKICWPIDVSRPACWAIPPSTLPEYAFGPQTDRGREELNRPRWLNSGTILGPANDLKDLLRATIAEIHQQGNETVKSDQFHLAEIFGRQEFARLQHRPELLTATKAVRYHGEEDLHESQIERKEPAMLDIVRTEFHIGIDYESSIFQTFAFYKQFLTWTRASSSWESPLHPGVSHQYDYSLPEDIKRSTPPFDLLHEEEAGKDKPNSPPSWEDVDLLYNTATKQAPALLHIAGGPFEKPFRQYWWSKLWFHPHSRELRLNGVRKAASGGEPEKQSVIGGYRWRNAQLPDAGQIEGRGAGGAWEDHVGGWLSWRGLCGRYEEEIYHDPGTQYFHAPPSEG